MYHLVSVLDTTTTANTLMLTAFRLSAQAQCQTLRCDGRVTCYDSCWLIEEFYVDTCTRTMEEWGSWVLEKVESELSMNFYYLSQ